MRVRAALCVLTLLALAGFHLQPSLAGPVPRPALEAPQSAPASPYGPTQADRDRSLVAALRAAQALKAQQDADLVAWYAAASKPAPARSVRSRPASAPVAADVAAPAYESGSIEALICSVFGDSCARAIRIARCESGLNPSARNRSGASGLFQLLGHGAMFEAHGWSPDDWSDPYKNTVVAFDLSRGGTSWAAWVCK